MAPPANTSLCVPDAVHIMKDPRGPHELGCPGPWLEAMAVVLGEALGSTQDAKPILINVGANKGYEIFEFLSQHPPAGALRGLSAAMVGKTNAWGRAVKNWAVESRSWQLRNIYCGFCGDCKRQPPPAVRRRHGGGFVHALELVPANRRLIRSVAATLGLGPAIQVHDLAASNETRAFYVPRSNAMAGVENFGAHHAMATAPGALSAAAAGGPPAAPR